MALFTLKERKRKMKNTLISVWYELLTDERITESTAVIVNVNGHEVARYDGKNSIPYEMNDWKVRSYRIVGFGQFLYVEVIEP